MGYRTHFLKRDYLLHKTTSPPAHDHRERLRGPRPSVCSVPQSPSQQTVGSSHRAWLLPVCTPASRPWPNFICIPVPSNLLGLASDLSGRADAPAAGWLAVTVPAGTTLLLPVVRRSGVISPSAPSFLLPTLGAVGRVPGSRDGESDLD